MTETYPEARAYIKKTLKVGVVEASLSPYALIDWMAVEDADYDVERCARIRGVRERTVERNVDAARDVFRE
jgi:hypothetical protein